MQKKTITNIVAAISFVLTGVFVSLHSSSSVSAYSLTVSTSGSVTANVMPSADGGIGTTVVTDNVNIISNCRAGYTMTIAGPSDNNLYLNGDSTNNTSGTYFSPVNGTSALNNSANANKWGYSLTANNGTGVFSALSSTPTTLKTPSQTASPNSDIDTTIPVYYGTAVNINMAPGSYTFSNSNSITYSVVMDTSCTIYSVQYQDNGADNPNGMGTTDASTGEKSVKQTNIAEDTKITLLAPNFKKAGYAFLGWSTDSQAYTHFTDNDNTNDPIIYGPNEDVVIDADIIATANSRNQINMYAVWIPALKDGNNNTVYMQEWDNTATTLPHDGCSTLTATVFDDTITDEKGKIIVTKNSVVALADKRDNEVYTVARLADGNCWMTENLRLEQNGTVGNNINDSNVTNQSLSQGYGGTTGTYGNFVGLATSESANFSNSTTSNSIYKSDGSGDVYNGSTTLEDIGTTSYPDYRFPRYNNSNNASALTSPTYSENYTDPSNPTATGTYKDSTISSYGNYYTWAAAIANTNYYIYEGRSNGAGTSICPSGWYLPLLFSSFAPSYGGTGGSQSGIGTGDVISNRFRAFPNNFLLSGVFSDSPSASVRGSTGFYWGKTNHTEWNSFSLALGPTSINASDHKHKYYGGSVRCLVGAQDVEIILDSNNNTGAISRLYGTPGNSITLPYSSSSQSASIAQPGYGFRNWNTTQNGSGTTYTSSFTIPAGSTGETLYAQWSPQYTITYVNNCYTYASANASCTQDASNSTGKQIINLNASGNGSGTLRASNGFTMTGWKIKEWTTNADGSGTAYPVSSTYSVIGASAGDGITLYAHWAQVYTIQYDGNGANNPNGMGTIDTDTGVKSVKQTNIVEGDPITLLASNFKRAGYGFAGWSTNPNATVTSGDKIYGPMETISAPAYPASGNIITMYAVWVAAKKDGSNNPVYLQDFTTSDCSALTKADFNTTTGVITPGSVIALTDKRDNQVYTVARLADGKCWMTENLRLEHAGTVGNNINNSSVTNQSLSQGYGGTTGTYGNFVGLADPESTGFSSSTTANTIYKSDGSGDVFNSANSTLEDIGTSNYPGYRFPRYNSSNTLTLLDSTTYTQDYVNARSPSASGIFREDNLYSYGNYYTWAAAMANTNYYNGSSTSEAAGTSICPSGWHLPSSGTTTNEYGVLSQNYGGNGSRQSNVGVGDIMSNRFRTFPNNFIYSGRFTDSSASSRGTYGGYLSRSARNNYYSWYLSLTSTYINPSETNLDKTTGHSIRCLIGS